jgi:uncharacterized membrane protein (UPF0127 family)
MPMRLNEGSMAEVHYFPGSGDRTAHPNTPREFAADGQTASNRQKYFIYNRTRERFVATDVEAAIASTDSLEARLRTLGPGGVTALWIFPYAAIAPSSVRFPLDLVILDDDSVVLRAIESFPLCGLGEVSPRAASVLVLQADALAQGEIRVGDQLMIAAPEEMKQYLQCLKEERTNSQAESKPLSWPSANSEEEAGLATAELAQSESASKPGEPTSDTPGEIALDSPSARETTELLPSPSQQPWEKRAGPRNWLRRMLAKETPDPRTMPREALAGLIAYFFTGGTPEGHPVRDISLSGLYIVTSERWYKDTVVRITLEDRYQPATERSITVNARVVRCGNDGVALDFILAGDQCRHGKAFELSDYSNGVDIVQLCQFIESLKAQ